MSSRDPKGLSRAVVEARAPAVVEADDTARALFRRLEYFPTPPWAARAGAELIQFVDPGPWVIGEPAAGGGHMAEPLGEYFPKVIASDVYPQAPAIIRRDWLDDAAWPADEVDWWVTNPPFPMAEDFVTVGLRRARRGVALLLRLSFIETAGRYWLLAGDQPLTLLAPFCERVAMTLGKWDPSASTATAYAWFLWRKGADPLPPRWVAPGTKVRLTKADDAARFGWAEPMSLFVEG